MTSIIQSPEQTKHDRINLERLTRRLERNILLDTSYNPHNPLLLSVKSRSFQNTIKYAQRLLENLYNSEVHDSPQLLEIKQKLDELDDIMDQRKSDFPPAQRSSFLSRVAVQSPPIDDHIGSLREGQTSDDFPVEDTDPPALPNPNSNPVAVLLPPTISRNPAPISTLTPASKSKAPDFLSNSLQTQDELSQQLAQMAAQLKLNAARFGESLTQDKAILEGAGEKLEANFENMKTQRVRLRDYSGKSTSTTCMTITAIVGVILAFIFTFFLIRLT